MVCLEQLYLWPELSIFWGGGGSMDYMYKWVGLVFRPNFDGP